MLRDIAGIYSTVKFRSYNLFLKLRYNILLYLKTMSSENSVLSSEDILMPPSEVQGMKKLNRDAFKKEIEVPYVNLNTENLKNSLKFLKPCLLKLANLPPVQGDDNVKKILLNPILFEKIKTRVMKKLPVEVLSTKLTLSYENFKHSSIFKAVLPPDIGVSVSGFSIIGHILHLNLKPKLFDYKYLIGEVFLDKYSNIRTVVNKAQTIDTEYRNFQIELLAGEPHYEVTVKENGCVYVFDFSKVFWNPRLVNEHEAIVKKAEPGDLIFDIFAGVGPFAIPLAKKKCTVHANDLNPDSYKWLCCNTGLNKVSDFLTAYNLDGKEFISAVVRDYMVKYYEEFKKGTIHIIMNLPAKSLEFLDKFQGLLKGFLFAHRVKVIIYCYFFLKKGEDHRPIIDKYFVGCYPEYLAITTVRNVAPNKQMMRITFELPHKALFGYSIPRICEHTHKKIRLMK